MVRSDVGAERMGWNEADDKAFVFKAGVSLADVPPVLRRKLDQSPMLMPTFGWPDGTIVAKWASGVRADDLDLPVPLDKIAYSSFPGWIPLNSMTAGGTGRTYNLPSGTYSIFWSFPADNEVRVGVGSFDPRFHVKDTTVLLTEDLGKEPNEYQGNWIPHKLRPATEDGIFFVGDSAGHCLPLTAEGIRTALYFGIACGRELLAVLGALFNAGQDRAAIALMTSREQFSWLHMMDDLHATIAAFPAQQVIQ